MAIDENYINEHDSNLSIDDLILRTTNSQEARTAAIAYYELLRAFENVPHDLSETLKAALDEAKVLQKQFEFLLDYLSESDDGIFSKEINGYTFYVWQDANVWFGCWSGKVNGNYSESDDYPLYAKGVDDAFEKLVEHFNDF